MAVLTIIGIIIGLMALYMFIEYLNNFSLRNYRYEFFSVAHLTQIIIGYWMIYFGRGLYTKALNAGGDLLNGELLMAIGAVAVLIILYKNFIATPLGVALALSAIQLALCLPLAVGAFFVLLIAIAVLAETKPVYVLNND